MTSFQLLYIQIEIISIDVFWTNREDGESKTTRTGQTTFVSVRHINTQHHPDDEACRLTGKLELRKVYRV